MALKKRTATCPKCGRRNIHQYAVHCPNCGLYLLKRKDTF